MTAPWQSEVRSTCYLALAVVLLVPLFPAAAAPPHLDESLSFDGEWSRSWTLEEGDAFDLSARIDHPSRLPSNARIEASWSGPGAGEDGESGRTGEPGVSASTGWSKVLHALDPDLYVVYRAPRAGQYTLRLSTIENRAQPVGELPHDTGLAPLATPLPTETPAVHGLSVSVRLRPVGDLVDGGLVLEAEPNNAPEQATDLSPVLAGSAREAYVVGGADDIEYFNNTRIGSLPDDWYRIHHEGAAPVYLSANLQLIEPVVSSRIRVYREGVPSGEEMVERRLPETRDPRDFNALDYVHPPASAIPGPVPVYTYEEGRALNERAHQQDRSYRTFVVRQLEPGATYYLRVEANQPHYELQVRLFDPAPYGDPVQAVRRAIHYHLAEIDAWLIHRPRNIAPHRRIRDANALFGENCMSCHTQSGVWGVADAFRNGYRPDGTEQNYRRLVNTMYESLRLTNSLTDAAVNTSVAPNDLGDGPAGTRVAGRNIVLHERAQRPKRLHARWQRRTANYVLQTADPKGINAAGRGSNFGPNVVFKFAAEILQRAWRDSGEPRYFFGLEERGRRILATGDEVRVTDDYGHRIEFVHRVWPHDYVDQVRRLTASPRRIAEARRLDRDLRARAATDLERLLALQREDGGWGFDPGGPAGDGSWRPPEDDHSYPGSTAVSLIALEAAGRGPADPVVSRGVNWLLQNQYPYGLWNAAAATGFVTTAYAIRALSRLHPESSPAVREDLRLHREDPFLRRLRTARDAQAMGEERHTGLLLEAVDSDRPQLRLYGLLGLGATLAHEHAHLVARHLGDPVKACREAAFWALRQLLLDGEGWDLVPERFRAGGDRERQSLLQALVTRAHLPGSEVGIRQSDLAAVLTAGMVDPHPGVRAYAFRAAWHWWVWNPPMREPINRAWMDALLRAEDEAQVEMALRYSTIALFVVNGQVNNITGEKYLDQQYPQLAELFAELAEWRESAPADQRRRLDRRLTAMAASHYMERANQQSPGQFAYSTPGATDLFGSAVLEVYEDAEEGAVPWKAIALEGARGILHGPLQDTVMELLHTMDPDVVAVAARALSNPGQLSLPARTTSLEPLLDMLASYSRQGRDADAGALAGFLARVRWDFEGISEQEEREFYGLLLGFRSRDRASAGTGSRFLLGRPALAPAAAPGEESLVPLVARILGENRSLHRREALEHLDGDPRLWLDSTEWVLAFRDGTGGVEEAIAGAVEAEALEIGELTFGRTTEQVLAGGLASGNTALIWEEGKVGAHISFALEVPAPGEYELLGAFLFGASHGIVGMTLNGTPVLEQEDFFREEVASTGPRPLGAYRLPAGQSLFTVTMLGTHPEAEPEFKFGLDYLKLSPIDDRRTPAGAEEADPVAAARERAVRMFVGWFAPGVPEEIRQLASRLAGSPSLRRNPEVRRAIAAYVESEPVRTLRNRLRNILNSDDEAFSRELRELLQEQPDRGGPEARPLQATDAFIRDILHFRDHVFTEMNRASERDGRACLSCHGVPGRVPTLYLHPPDGGGHIGAAQLVANYRRLQARVDVAEPEDSLLLRKPLNVQTGQEEGHQGGVRYAPEEEGFGILRAWVLRQAELQRDGG